ncbi:MAG: hypothetical protein JXB39_08605 [Deltaproteobacteria bacterium]|nr:hypothetical protein [Deltaproteobacteria bacterium]
MPADDLVLGISDDYVSNVALFQGGRPLFAAANERFTRKKGDAGFPAEALGQALDHGGVRLSDVDRLVIANRTHFVYRVMRAQFKDYKHDFFNIQQKLYCKYHDLVEALPAFGSVVGVLNRALLTAKTRTRVLLCDHHTAHAAGAVYSSGFDRCLAVTVDNLGDGFSAKVHTWQDGRLEYLWGSRASDSPGQFYGEITQLLGFNPLRHAGKVTGLSARGDPEPAMPIMKELFFLSPDRRRFGMMPSWQRWKDRGPYFRLGLFSPEDIAAAAQKRLEDVISGFVAHALEVTGHNRIALAGGCAANVKMNLVLKQLPGVEALHVHPAMSDEGLGFGAAAWFLLQKGIAPRTLDTVFLGPGFSEAEVEAALAKGGVPSMRPRDMADTVAGLLEAGHVVARCDGRLEYGPRALGNRSILYRPDDPSVSDWLNEKLRRTEFMPFAPVTLWEDAEACYDATAGARETARFMTMAFPCTSGFARLCPGVVHVDGTARPQLVRREECPEYYDIVAAYKRRTGLPSLINTSFNMHEEPIVNGPSDAVNAFLAADLDYLAIGRRLAWNPARPALGERF